MYRLTPLRYNLDELEPYLSEYNTQIHYYNLYRGYQQKLNRLFLNNDLEFKPIEEVLYNINDYDEEIRDDIINYGGGYANHTLFFNSLIPPTYPQTLEYTLLDTEIDKQFGSKNDLLNELKKSMLQVFGSGWTFLVTDEEGNLSVVNAENQDSPLSDGLYPLIALDMWEHSYYLDYQSDRDEYVDNLVKLIDFKFANYRYTNKYQFM